MEVILSMTIGALLSQRVPENVECIISTFLAEDPEENRAKEQYKLMCASIYGKRKKEIK